MVEAQGSRVLWVVGTAALLGTAAATSATRIRRLRAGNAAGGRTVDTFPLVLLIAWAAALWAPWAASSTTYTFDAAPVVPALALLVVTAADRLLGVRRSALVTLILVAAAALEFAATWPHLRG